MKKKTCTTCEGIVVDGFDAYYNPIWICRCCGIETSRRINKPSAKRQAKTDEFNKLIDELTKEI